MAIKPSERLPIEIVRDLLGIARALYAEAKDCSAGAPRLDELRHIGDELRAAIQLAERTAPGTMGHRAAWMRAEKAVERLGGMVNSVTPMRPAFEAMTRRFVRG